MINSSFFLQVILLVVGFILLIKGADYFVEGASKIADRFHIPQLVIGLTIVAFGTSAPEAAISITSVAKGNAGISIGNVIGSNIFNVLIILGITACIIPLKIQESTLKFELPYMIFVTIILGLLGYWDGELTLRDGVILWILFFIFFAYLIVLAKKGGGDAEEIHSDNKESLFKIIIVTILGMVAIIWGSDLTVDNATLIAKTLKMSDRLIGLTIIAFGTSLPELITSITAARKGKSDIAIGNIIGSNLFNILFVTGTAALIGTIPFVATFGIDLLVALAAAIFLFFCVVKDRTIRRAGGITMLVGYAVYFVFLLLR